jgi:hypothetical protein
VHLTQRQHRLQPVVKGLMETSSCYLFRRISSLHSDGLTIMGKGLGLCTVAAALLMVHHATPDSGGVVIILGAASERWLMLCM